MLIRILRANSIYNYILLPIVGGLMLLKSLLNPGIFPTVSFSNTSPLCLFLYQSNIPYWGALLINFVSVIIICIQLLYINAVFSFVRERTFLPAYLYIFVVYALPDLHVIQPVFFSAIFILLAIQNIFSSFEKKKTIGNAFNAGFLTGMAALFYPGVILLVFLVPFGLYTLKNIIGWREYIASLLGLLLTLLYTFFFYFIFSDVSKLFEIFSNIIVKKEGSIFHFLPVQIFFAFLILITIVSSIFIVRQYDEKKISTRRYFKILSFYFFTSLLLFILPSVSHELLVILAIPLTFLITNYLIFKRRRFWAELFFTVLILISMALQFFIK